MTGGLRRLAAKGAGVALALVVAACGKVLSYPDEVAENSAALCSDGNDNDYDGNADCDDEECDGFCHEESAAECSDGRDNDRDGLVDAADPRCWLKRPPKAERCAEASGVEIFETFDGDNIGFADPSSTWQIWGSGSLVDRLGHQSTLRGDPTLTLIKYQPNLDPAVAPVRLVRQRPFAGSWQDFELAFSASVPPQALLRVSIAPMPLVPSLKPPLANAANALFAVTLDALRSPPTLAIDVDGIQVAEALTPTQGLCGTALCSEYFLGVNVDWDGAGFRATVTYPNGTTVELHAPPPRALSLPPSRLIVWGAPARYEMRVILDDLYLSVKPEWPCGFRSPALTVESCELSDGMAALGHTVSVARGADGHYCALVTASNDDETGPERLTAWSSDDGERWRVATATGEAPIELPEGVELVGAGVAADDRWHAVLSYRDGGEVRLAYSDGDGCEHWGPLEQGATLFPDAESPSYVIAGGHHDVYFTRPPGEARPERTLWRVRREQPESPPEQLAELGADVAAPVAVQRVGAIDLVLTYPVLPGSEQPGVGFLVGAEGGRDWQKLEQSPLVLPGTFDAFPGDKLAFDDNGVASAALAWSKDKGILLYAGRSSDGLAAPSRLQPLTSELAVGVARLGSASGTLSQDPTVPPRTCGDGVCDEREDSVRCEADCPAGGTELLGDAFADAQRWQTLSSELEPSKIRYLTDDPPALNWTSGEPTWSVLALERAVAGDFELSFDLFVGYTDPTRETCSLYVGLGTAPDLAVDTSNNDLPTNPGLFARVDVDSDCPSRFHFQPVVLGDDLESSELPGKTSCLDEPALRSDAWHHVVLRRRGNDAIIQTPREDGCGLVQLEGSFSGTRAALPALLVGFGGASFESCRRGEPSMDPNDPNAGRPIGPQVSRGTIRNVELRSLEAEP